MTPTLVFVALVAIALLSGLGRRGDAAQSVGAEFVVAGIIVGPGLLGFLRRETLEGFEPLILMCLGWMAAAVGVRHGVYRRAFVGMGAYGRGVVLGSVTLATLLGVILAGRFRIPELGSRDGLLFACMACAALGTASDRDASSGSTTDVPLERLRAGLVAGATLPALAALCAAVVFDPPDVHVPWPRWVWSLLGPTLGAVFGMTVAALLGRKFRYGEFWPVVIGASLLGAGLASRFRTSILATTFLLGASLAAVSPHRQVVRDLMKRASAPVLLPLAILAGALVVLPKSGTIWLLSMSLVGARVVAQYALGRVVAALVGVRGGHDLGLSLLPMGHLGMAIGVMSLLRAKGPLGAAVLLSACLAAVVGELLGSRAAERVGGGGALAAVPDGISEGSTFRGGAS